MLIPKAGRHSNRHGSAKILFSAIIMRSVMQPCSMHNILHQWNMNTTRDLDVSLLKQSVLNDSYTGKEQQLIKLQTVCEGCMLRRLQPAAETGNSQITLTRVIRKKLQ
jgi:hypothetical protein